MPTRPYQRLYKPVVNIRVSLVALACPATTLGAVVPTLVAASQVSFSVRSIRVPFIYCACSHCYINHPSVAGVRWCSDTAAGEYN